MINYTQIRDDVITQLKSYLNIPVVLADQNEPKPSYPHFGYKVINPYSSEDGLAAETSEAIASLDENFDYDIKYTRSELPTMTISITTYSNTVDQAETIALSAASWFKFLGYEYLKSKNVVVVEVTDIQDRDTLIVDDYDRRRGFDVKLRVISQLTNIVSNIESAVITKI